MQADSDVLQMQLTSGGKENLPKAQYVPKKKSHSPKYLQMKFLARKVWQA